VSDRLLYYHVTCSLVCRLGWWCWWWWWMDNCWSGGWAQLAQCIRSWDRF